MPFTKALGLSHPPQIASVGNHLIVTIPTTGEIRKYDLQGNFISTQNIDWSQGYIFNPIPMPYFANIIKDSDDNLLFFEFPKEEGANIFNVWVYRNKGDFIAKSSFTTEGYDLEIKPLKWFFTMDMYMPL